MAKRGLWMVLLLGGAGLLSGCSTVVARVNGTNISQKEFYEELERAQGQQVLQMTILKHLVIEKATAEKLLPTPEEIQARLDELKKERFEGDDAKFRAWMKASSLDDTILVDQIRYELAAFKLRTRRLKTDDAELKKFFDENHAALFDKPARVSFRQIVVPEKAQADKLIAQLNNENEMFAQLARQISVDSSSKENGGLYEDIPWDAVKQQEPAIHDALKGLAKNQITQKAVQLRRAPLFVVLKLIDSKPPEPAVFDKLKAEVKQAYLQQSATSEQELLAEVTKGANVVVLAERYKESVQPAFTAPDPTAGLPDAVKKDLEKGPDIAPPTPIDEKSMPKPLTPGGN
ncbi:MAG: peptidyl-prolyl cis-trans isomerase [Fimbriimonadaceae bacterium]|nr:peptidyl-prolyl cis-trans isomerase [Fimbriimonadaceae bacterium]